MRTIIVSIAIMLVGCAEFTKFAGLPGPFLTTKERACVEGDTNCFELRQCELPIRYAIKSEVVVSSEEKAGIISAFNVWNNIIGKEIFIFNGITSIDPEFTDTPNLLIVYLQPFYNALHDESYGWSSLRWSKKTGCIWNSDIFITPKTTSNKNADFLKLIVTHEIGHVLGLEHTLNNNDIMRKYLKEYEGSIKPSKREEDLVREKYNEEM